MIFAFVIVYFFFFYLFVSLLRTFLLYPAIWIVNFIIWFVKFLFFVGWNFYSLLYCFEDCYEFVWSIMLFKLLLWINFKFPFCHSLLGKNEIFCVKFYLMFDENIRLYYILRLSICYLYELLKFIYYCFSCIDV